jgi:hypothetical protein
MRMPVKARIFILLTLHFLKRAVLTVPSRRIDYLATSRPLEVFFPDVERSLHSSI